MFAGSLLTLMLAAASVDSVPRSLTAGPVSGADRVGVGISMPAIDADTVKKPRKKAVQLSDGYEQRLQIHKLASWATLPLFAGQYITGDKLFKDGRSAGDGVAGLHGAFATGVAVLFGVNTLTGAMNWWETRDQESGRTWRTIHSSLMLLGDAGFTVTGLLSDAAENSGDKRRKHRQMAIVSMGVSSLGYIMMLKPFRQD